MINRSRSPRTDLPYLRRRQKPGAAPVQSGAAPVAASSSPAATRQVSAGLNLSRPGSSSASGQQASAQQSSGQPAASRQSPSQPASSGGISLRPAPIPAPASTPAPAASSSSGGVGLSLGRNQPASNVSGAAERAEVKAAKERAALQANQRNQLFPAPGIDELYELDRKNRVLRLSPLESSVGTLEITGSTALVWENDRKVVGAADSNGHSAGTPSSTDGNRPLVSYVEKTGLVPLRHLSSLRRALLINRSNYPMGIRIANGGSVAVPPPSNGQQLVVLVQRIGNILEFRTESVPAALEDNQIWAEFDFTMTLRAPTASFRR